MFALARGLRSYNPRRRWLRRFDSVRRLVAARRSGLLSSNETAALLVVARQVHRRLRFAHGDVTARNVIVGPDGFVLIDWEWAGLYPQEYELAFLWYSLVDVEQGRARVEARLRADAANTTGEAAFLLSALLVQLWHLQQWSVAAEFREKHLATSSSRVSSVERRPVSYGAAAPRRTVTTKRLPVAAVGSTRAVPPIAPASSRTIASPRPVPIDRPGPSRPV
jgi:aminoglycoside phosphotransferase (APT) family kinase protein